MVTEENKTPTTQEQPPWLTKHNIKLAVWLVCVILAAIIVVQNWGEVETQLLFFKVLAPQSLLLILMLAIGFILGLTVRVSRKKKS